jgi:cell division protein FtsB
VRRGVPGPRRGADRRPPAAARLRGLPQRLTGRAALLGVTLLALAGALAVPGRQYLDQRSDIATLRDKAAAQEKDVREMQAELERWKDPAYVRQQAREKLHFVNPGDTGFQVVPAPAAAPAPGTSHGRPAGLWQERLWESVRKADLTSPTVEPVPGVVPPAPAAPSLGPATP